MAVAEPTPTSRSAGPARRISWPAPAAIAILIVGAVAGLSSVFAWVHGAWFSFAGVGVYSHGYLVLALALWMAWTNWRANPPALLAPQWWALVPLAGLAALLAAMELVYIDSSRALVLPLMFLAATALVFGAAAAQRFVVPALFLYFGLLPWWMLDPPLQDLATVAVEWIMSFGSVPAYIEGNFIHIPAGVFEIASACSGLSFFLSALTLAAFYSAMYLRRWLNRTLLVIAAAVAALFSNWIRIWTLILIGHYTEMEHWLVGEHYLYGWVLFVIALAPVLWFARYLEDREIARRSDREDTEDCPARPGASARAAVSNSTLVAAFAGATLLALPRLFAGEVTTPGAITPAALPDRTAAGHAQVPGSDAWRPSFANAREGRAHFAVNGSVVDVYRAVYPEQGRDHHLFLRGNDFAGERWRPLGQGLQDVTLKDDSLRVIEYRGEIAGRQRLVWAWYEVAGRAATGRLAAKLAEVRALPAGRSDGIALAVSAECGADCEAARERLAMFLRGAVPSLQWQPDDQGEEPGTQAP